MNIVEASLYAKLGYRIIREVWDPAYWLSPDALNGDPGLSIEDLTATDWKIVLEELISHLPVKYDTRGWYEE
jgi:hypothetical protein